MSAGVKISSGRLRVDAARAVDKLREYQLPDPTAWVLEVVRAAIAFGASEVRVSGDADDVRVAWDGGAPDVASLARLFDELVDPAPRADRRPHRLLATGVNTALGLEPRWVDVVVTDGSGGADFVRYAPGLLDTRDGAAEGLRSLRARKRRASSGAPRAGGLVHLRRFPLLDAVPLMIGYGEPRELSIVRRSCDDSRVPVVVGRTELGRGRSHEDLLRVGLGDGLDGFVAIVDPTFARPAAQLVVAELGVVVARYTMTLADLKEARAPLPVRVYVDAARMPTNASRSAVRLDEPPVSEAVERGQARFFELVSRLAGELGDEPEHAWDPGQRERLRAAALTLCAAHGAGAGWRRAFRDPPSALAPLMNLPLVRDALGRPRALGSFGRVRGAEYVHFGREPLDQELEPWLGDALYVPPGDAAAVLLGDWAPADAAQLAETAHRYRRRRGAFARERSREPDLEPDPGHLLVVPVRAPGRSLKSCVPSAWFEVEGLRGEVALRLGAGRGASVLLDGREITRWLDERFLEVDGVVTAEGLTPTLDYSGLLDNDARSALRAALGGATVVACESLALRWRGARPKGDRARSVASWIPGATGAEGARIAAVLRRGVLYAMSRLAERSIDVDVQARRDAGRRALLASRSPLRAAAIWPKVGGGYATTDELFAQADTPPHAVGYGLGPAPGGAAPAGRPVYELSRSECSTLGSFMPAARLIDYARVLVRPLRALEPGELARAVMEPLGVALELEPAPHLRVAIAWGVTAGSTISGRHWGATLFEEALPEPIPACRVLVDDPSLVPTRDFESVVAVPDYPVSAWARSLARGFVDALTGQDVPGLFLGPHNVVDARGAQAALLEWIARADGAAAVLGEARWRRLRDLPLVRRLGRAGYSTLAEVSADLDGGLLEWLPVSEAAAVDLAGWHPVCADAVSVRAFAKILGCGTSDARPRLVLRRRAARREHALSRHRARDPVDPAAGWTGPRVEIKGRGVRAGWATFSAADSGAHVEVLIESRPFRSLTVPEALPLRLVLDLPPSAADDDFQEISDVGHRRIRHAIGAGSRGLLRKLSEVSPTSLTGAPEVYRLLLAWCARLDRRGGNAADDETVERLAKAQAFPTVQGEHVALARALGRGGALRVACWDEPWLGAEAGRELVLDRPVLRLPRGEEAAYRAMLRVLFAGGTRDVSREVGRLQAKRRVERGLMQAPRLVGDYDARFRYDLSELLDEATHADTLGVLGIGEVAFARSDITRVTYERGGRQHTAELALIPAIHVAAQAPTFGSRSTGRVAKKRLRGACEVLISLVVRRLVDETLPDQLPVWVRRQLLDASLAGGALHLSRLEDTPMFETSVGGWITPREVLAQAERFGAVWTTDARQELPPLDPARIALRLDEDHAAQLDGYATTLDATEELLLDDAARRNLAQAPVTSLEPSAVEMSAALSVVSLELSGDSSDDPRGSIVLLQPGYEALEKVRLSRSFHPLGELSVDCIWPVACRIDDPALTPDRTWSGPVEDAAHRALVGQIRTRVRAAVAAITPVPVSKLAASRVGSLEGLSFPRGARVMGVIWLEDELAPGSIRLSGPGTERTEACVDLSGRPLPLQGELRLTIRVGAVRFRKLCVELHRRLLVRLTEQFGSRHGERRDRAFEHLARAVRAGAQLTDEELGRVGFTGFVDLVGGAPQTLAELRRHLDADRAVAVCSAEERDEAIAAGGELALFVDDGTPVARSVLELVGARAVPWRLAGAVGDGGAPAADVSALDGSARRASASPLHPLAAALLARWRSLSLPGVREVRLDGRRKNPPIVWDDATAFRLSKRHPAVRRALTALETDAPSAEALAVLLLAHAAGARRRELANPSRAAERAMLTELMERLADSGG